MRQQIHCSHSIEGPLMNWKKSDWNRAAKGMTIDGKNPTGDELKMEFLRMYGEGIKYLKMGECDNWSDQKGCMGHVFNEKTKQWENKK